MKIALVTDTHFGVRNDNKSLLDYQEKFYSQVFFPELKKRNITRIFHLGDLVDRRKYINFVTLRRMKNMFFEPAKAAGIDIDAIVGNHDVPFKNTNEVNSLNELFDTYGVRYYSSPETVVIDEHPILIMPWINNSNYAECIEAMKNTDAQVMFAHLEVAGCQMDKGTINQHGMQLTQFRSFDKVYTGHFHHRSVNGNVMYLGAPYEMTWIDYQDEKGFHIYDTETREVEFIKNPFSIFYKLYYNDQDKTLEELTDKDFSQYENSYVKVIRQTNNNPYWFDQYMDKLAEVNPTHIQVVEDHLNLDLDNDEDLVDEAEDTMTIISKYIDNLGEEVPKNELDKLIRSLYNEALSMEA